MKNMLRIINLHKLTIILLLFSNIIYAQSILVTGKVVDKQGQPLPGVSILLKDLFLALIRFFDDEVIFNTLPPFE